MNNVLMSEIRNIQIEYLELLKQLKAINNSEIIPLANEVLTFWFRKRKIINLFLDSLSKSKKNFIHTGAAYMNIYQKQHLPFLLLDGNHIWDDPLPSYINSFKASKMVESQHELRSVFMILVSNNIKIISSLKKYVYVIPVRFIFEIDNLQAISDNGNRLFLDIFKPELKITDIKTYHSAFNSIHDIGKGVQNTIKKIVFPSNAKGDFIEQFKICKEWFPEVSRLLNDTENFYLIVNGGFTQAESILLVCATYNLLPYIHYYPAVHYLLLLYPIFSMALNLEEIILWTILGYSISRNFDSSKFKSFTTKRFMEYTYDKQFTSRLTEKIKTKDFNLNNLELSKIENSVKEELDSFYPRNPDTYQNSYEFHLC